MRSTSVLLVSLLVWFESTTVTGAAESREQKVRLELQAAGNCATQAELADLVRARTPRVRLERDAPDALVLRATLETRTPGRVVGELLVLRDGSAVTLRRLVARTCSEALDGLALIIAITFDPDVSAERPSPDDATPSLDPGQQAREHEPLEQTAPPKNVTTSQQVEVSAPSTPSAPWHFEAFGFATAALGPAPETLGGVGAYVLLTRRANAAGSFALALTPSQLWSADHAEPEGSARFSMTTLGADACVSYLETSSVHARACGSALLGIFSVTSHNARNAPGPSRRPFGNLGAAGLISVRLVRPLMLFGRVATGVNLVRDRFEFGEREFHRVSSFTHTAALGLGLTLE